MQRNSGRGRPMKSRMLGVVAAEALLAPVAKAQTFPWSNPGLDPDRRAELLLGQMTLDEKIALVHGNFPRVMKPGPPPGVVLSAGYIAGIPRLGVPALRESDASLGVATAGRK